MGILHRLRGFFARESTQGLDSVEREDLTQAQLRATRPIVSGVLLCGAGQCTLAADAGKEFIRAALPDPAYFCVRQFKGDGSSG